MVVGHAIRAMGRIVKGLVSKSSTAIETKTSGEISLKTFHFSRPVDCDFFFHMNNCMYFRHAELARWELLPRTGILQAAFKHKWMFLVVSQEADYLLPLPPLTKFAVRTTATTDETNKYLYFTHDFVSEDGETLYCKANVKAIVKEMSGKSKGKTVRPMHMQSLTSMQWLS